MTGTQGPTALVQPQQPSTQPQPEPAAPGTPPYSPADPDNLYPDEDTEPDVVMN